MEALGRVAERVEAAEAAAFEAEQDLPDVDALALGELRCEAGNISGAGVLLEPLLASKNDLLEPRIADGLDVLGFYYSVTEGSAAFTKQVLQEALELRVKLAGQDSLVKGTCLLTIGDALARQGSSMEEQVEAMEQAKAAFSDAPAGVKEAWLRSVACRLNHLRRMSSIDAASSGTAVRVSGPHAHSHQEALDRLFVLLVPGGRWEFVAGKRAPDSLLEAMNDLDAAVRDVGGNMLSPTSVKDLHGFLAKLVEGAAAKHGEASVLAAQWLALQAEVFGARGDYASQRRCLEKVLRAQEHEFGMDSLFLARTLRALAGAQGLSGEPGALKSRWHTLGRALDILETESGAGHPEAVDTRLLLRASEKELAMLKDPMGDRTVRGLMGEHRAEDEVRPDSTLGGCVIFHKGVVNTGAVGFVQPKVQRQLLEAKQFGGGSGADAGGLFFPSHAVSVA